MKNMLCEDIDKKIAEARNAALEEAAGVCEDIANATRMELATERNIGLAFGLEAAAAAIRALKEADDE